MSHLISPGLPGGDEAGTIHQDLPLSGLEQAEGRVVKPQHTEKHTYLGQRGDKAGLEHLLPHQGQPGERCQGLVEPRGGQALQKGQCIESEKLEDVQRRNLEMLLGQVGIVLEEPKCRWN